MLKLQPLEPLLLLPLDLVFDALDLVLLQLLLQLLEPPGRLFVARLQLPQLGQSAFLDVLFSLLLLLLQFAQQLLEWVS